MKELIMVFFVGDLLVLLIVGPLYFRSLKKMFVYVEKNRSDLWNDLGRPSLLYNNSIGNSSRVIKLLISKKYEEYGDSDLIRICGRTRRLLFGSFFLGFFLIVITIPMIQV